MRGGSQAIQFNSVADGDDHKVLVTSATTETWLPFEYLLEGWAVNVDTTRHQIYLAPLLVTMDQSTAPGDADITTHAQRMLASIEAQLEKLAENVLDMTDVEGTRIQRAKREELTVQRARYLRERQSEVAKMNAKSGKPSGRKIHSRLLITYPGSSGRNFGAGNSVFNTEFP